MERSCHYQRLLQYHVLDDFELDLRRLKKLDDLRHCAQRYRVEIQRARKIRRRTVMPRVLVILHPRQLWQVGASRRSYLEIQGPTRYPSSVDLEEAK
jgi:hypothetical protein